MYMFETFLGSSRGGHDTATIVDALKKMDVNILFVIGGDGSMRGAFMASQEITRQGLKISVVGIPKTIDNDIPFIDKSFGMKDAHTTLSRCFFTSKKIRVAIK